MAIPRKTDSDYQFEVGIVVNDTEAALGFYRDTLGLEVTGTFAHPGLGVKATAVRIGDTCLKLLEYAETPNERNPKAGAIGLSYLTVPVDDVAAAVAACEAAGHEIDMAPMPVDELPGEMAACEFAFVLDPDGTRVELLRGSPWLAA